MLMFWNLHPELQAHLKGVQINIKEATLFFLKI
jgi:hypothetical protein